MPAPSSPLPRHAAGAGLRCDFPADPLSRFAALQALYLGQNQLRVRRRRAVAGRALRWLSAAGQSGQQVQVLRRNGRRRILSAVPSRCLRAQGDMEEVAAGLAPLADLRELVLSGNPGVGGWLSRAQGGGICALAGVGGRAGGRVGERGAEVLARGRRVHCNVHFC